MAAAAPVLAWPRLRAFAGRHGKPQVQLAMHAAVPTGLTPELLNLLRVNFVPEAHFVVEADVLLSDLVLERGGGYYEMAPEIRDMLQHELRREHGAGRIERVADFLYSYCENRRCTPVTETEQRFLLAQEWTALSYLRPGAAATFLAGALQNAIAAAENQEVRRVSALIQRLEQPLGSSGGLARYAAGLEYVLDGDHDSSEVVFESLGGMDHGHVVGGVALPAPATIASSVSSGRLASAPVEFGAEPAPGTDAEPDAEPAPGTDAEPDAEPAPGTDAEPDAETESAAEPAQQTGQSAETGGERSTSVGRSFETDVFISHARIDDESVDEKRPGWVSEFSQTLRMQLSRRRGRDAVVWLDPSGLDAGSRFDEAIDRALANSAAFISIVSPRYLDSEWCLRELQAFAEHAEHAERGGLIVDNGSRIFKVYMLPVDRSAEPEVMQGLLGYEFFREAEAGRPRLLDPDSDDDSRRAYHTKLNDLSADISALIERLAQPAGAPSSDPQHDGDEAPSPTLSEPKVLLLSHDDDARGAVAIGNHLDDAELGVVTKTPGDEPKEFTRELRELVQECDGVLVYQHHAPQDWPREQLRLVEKYVHLSEPLPAVVALLRTGSASKQPHAGISRHFMRIDVAHEPEPGDLKDFVDQVRRRAGRDAGKAAGPEPSASA